MDEGERERGSSFLLIRDKCPGGRQVESFGLLMFEDVFLSFLIFLVSFLCVFFPLLHDFMKHFFLFS